MIWAISDDCQNSIERMEVVIDRNDRRRWKKTGEKQQQISRASKSSLFGEQNLEFDLEGSVEWWKLVVYIVELYSDIIQIQYADIVSQ